MNFSTGKLNWERVSDKKCLLQYYTILEFFVVLFNKEDIFFLLYLIPLFVFEHQWPTKQPVRLVIFKPKFSQGERSGHFHLWFWGFIRCSGPSTRGWGFLFLLAFGYHSLVSNAPHSLVGNEPFGLQFDLRMSGRSRFEALDPRTSEVN